jgi:putative transposase
VKLRWRVSGGARRSLGWVPFKAARLKRQGACLRFAGKCVRVFERERLDGVKWQAGCFAQDALGDWWLCLPVKIEAEASLAPREAVGIDLGVKDIAATSDGERLQAGRWTHRYEKKLASAQRRGHKRQAKRIHRIVGDVSSLQLVRTRMAKSVLDSGYAQNLFGLQEPAGCQNV